MVWAFEDAWADDEFEDIVRGDDACGAAIFVEDDGEGFAAFGEGDEEVVEGDGFWDEEGVLLLASGFIDDAFDGVRGAAEDGEVAVFGVREGGAAEIFVAVDIIAFDVDARGHFIVGAKFGEAQDAFDHFGVRGRNIATFRGRFKDGNEFAIGECAAFTFECGGEGFGGEAQDVVERGEEPAPKEEAGRDKGREHFRVFEGEAFGGDFAKDEEKDRHDGDGEVGGARDVGVEEAVANCGDGEVDEGVADEQGGEEHGLVGQAF